MKKINLRIVLLIVIIMCITRMFIQLVFPTKIDSSMEVYGSEKLSPIGLMNANDVFVQEATCKNERVTSIEIILSTYNVVNESGSIYVKVDNLNTNKSFKKIINLNEVEDNQRYLISSEEVLCEKNEKINLTVGYDNYQNNSLTMWQTRNEKAPNFTINGNEGTGQIYFITDGKSNKSMIYWYYLVIMFVCLLLYSVSGGKNEKK